MPIELRSPIRVTRKASELPNVFKLQDGRFFSTWASELLGASSATYDTTTVSGQMNAYTYCAPVNAIINRQADALRSGRFMVTDSKGNEVMPGNSYLRNFLTKPNPLQDFKQFISQAYAFMKIHGIAYCLPVYGISRTEPSSMWVVPNFMVTPIYSNRVFGQTRLSEIITGYRIDGVKDIAPAEDLLVFRDSTVSSSNLLDKWIVPQSRLVAVKDQVNSVIASTDSWLTISKRKGIPLGLITSGSKDATSSIPLTAQEKKELHDELNSSYGLSGDAKKFFITAAAASYQQVSLPVKDLMILEGVEACSRHIANQFNMPFALMEYEKGASLSNGGEMKEAWKALYANQVIPDAEMICSAINAWWGLGKVNLEVFFDHLEIFQKGKEETARAIQLLTAGLDKAFINKIITVEEYRLQLSEVMEIDPEQVLGNTYYDGSNNANNQQPRDPNATGEGSTAQAPAEGTQG